MKKFRTIILIAGILIAGMAFKSVAQVSPGNDSKAENETYTLQHDKHKDKHKEHKMKAKPKDKHKHKLKAEAKHNDD
jgi:sortase (surface protein transpeptidase)